MKIAVTHENGQVFQHFGHCAEFKIYEVENGEIKSSAVVGTDGAGHGALAGFLQLRDVEALICGGIGAGAKNALAAAGIAIYPGVSGDTDAAAEAFLAGILDFNPDTECDHHGHSHEHECHSHGKQQDCSCH